MRSTAPPLGEMRSPAAAAAEGTSSAPRRHGLACLAMAAGRGVLHVSERPDWRLEKLLVVDLSGDGDTGFEIDGSQQPARL